MFGTAVERPRATALLAAGALIAAGLWSSPPAYATGTILDQQIAVVTADHQPVIGAAQQALSGAESDLTGARYRAASDQALVARAATLAAQASSALGADTSALGTDTSARDAATAAIVDDRRRLQAIGVELYVGPEVTPLRGPDDLAKEQQQEFADQVIEIGTGVLIDDLHLRKSQQQAAATAVAVDTRRVGDDRATLAQVTALRDNRVAILARDQAAVSLTTATVAIDRAVLGADNAALAKAVTALANPPGAPADGTPSIVGVAALDAAQLVGWYNAEGWADLTAAPIQQLVGWYLSEGAAEGIRGDVAFAQGMVETGGFASNDAITLNNYAGIGHCDSCSAGLGFASPQLGVRGQIQLLHSFADATLTSAQLANPLAVAALTPQTQPDRGCCTTWQSLTGKWATDPLYGHTIMGVYQSMLSFALSQPQG